MKEHEHPYWKTGMLRPVPSHVKDEVGIRRHIMNEMKELGLGKPKGELKKIPAREVFSQENKSRKEND